MKVYFLASPRVVGKRQVFFADVYRCLKKEHRMVDDLVWKLSKMKNVGSFYKVTLKERTDRFRKWMGYIRKCDVVVVEVSGHSMTLGYVVGKALELNKPVVALYKKGQESYFVSGIANFRLQMVEYGKDDVFEVLDKAIKKAKGLIDVRFNFFVSPKILTYLDWVAMNKKVPRSVFLRELIEKQMRKDKEFRG